jgi:hypothetical protein
VKAAKTKRDWMFQAHYVVAAISCIDVPVFFDDKVVQEQGT